MVGKNPDGGTTAERACSSSLQELWKYSKWSNQKKTSDGLTPLSFSILLFLICMNRNLQQFLFHQFSNFYFILIISVNSYNYQSLSWRQFFIIGHVFFFFFFWRLHGIPVSRCVLFGFFFFFFYSSTNTIWNFLWFYGYRSETLVL